MGELAIPRRGLWHHPIPDEGAGMHDPMIDPALAAAFDQMWGRFPDPMLLVSRDRTILAQNDAARTQPWGVVGGKCYDADAAQGHVCQGCQANAALDQGTAIACEGARDGMRIRDYWIPVKGARDVYVHGHATMGASPLPIVS
jgi:hypothetical protein